jgi:acyl transferase domain-containing protein/SAM-dependent methyltransferase/acyl carrier protein
METTSPQTGTLSPTKQALLTIQKMQARIDALERTRNEPLAVIGLGCRFPGGADSPDAFWRLLRDGQDAIVEVPADRWDIDAYYDADPDVPGKTYTRRGGFLGSVDGFDPQFFGISPREAAQLDPQQRLLLEVCWETLEHANLVPEQLLGSFTGVFVGITSPEYAGLTLWSADEAHIDAYSGTGGSLSVAAGRLSYVLGLTGPCMSLDTACSSSLVSVHLACQSLRLGECDLALAGGVNLMLGPELHINFSKARMLAPDGRCKAFAEAADGYGRGEGCGVIALKRLSDAQADGDRVLALIRGSAINHDGPSGGLTVPNGPAQEKVIRRALADAGVEAKQIGYIEAHGTGTALGDPIEMGALGKVFGERDSEGDPLIVGSAKTNFGHLESAAGIAGLIKVILSLQHEEIPPHLHFERPNPHIDWEALPVEIPTNSRAWPVGDRRRFAGVSSFGFSGTNGHIVLEEAPAVAENEEKPSASERPYHLLTLSARTAEGLTALAGSYEQHLLARSGVDVGDVCFTAGTCRSQFAHRFGIVGATIEKVREKLAAAAMGEEVAGLVSGRLAGSEPPGVAFLFTGQGSQYAGMGRQLYETQPAFRQILDQCDALLRDYLEQPLLTVLYPEPGVESPLDDTAYTQPALFALEYALAQLWRSWGIEPAILMGHSVGEYVAACVAGVFDLEDGLRLISARARLMQALPRNGAMVSARADEERVREMLEPHAERVSLAAINGPQSVVFSGERQAVEAVSAELQSQGIETKPLQVSHAFHSPLMEPMLEEFAEVARQISYSAPRIGVVSNLMGGVVGEELCSADYWCRHVRQPVRFAAGMETLHQQGYELFLEIGPKPVLLGMGRRCLPDDAGAWLPSLRPGRDDWQQLLESLGGLYVRGAQIDWESFDQNYDRYRVSLPTYPFQRQRYWTHAAPPQSGKDLRAGAMASLHPLLDRRVYSAALPDGEIVFEALLQPETTDFLAHHRIFQVVVMPAAAHLEMGLAAGAAVLKSTDLLLEEVVIHRALILPEDQVKTVQVVLHPEGTAGYAFQIFSLDADGVEPTWTCHTSGVVKERAGELRRADLAAMQAQCRTELSVDEYYRRTSGVGIEHGASFQALEQIWLDGWDVLAKLRLPEELVDGQEAFLLHPVLLDAGFQMLGIPLLNSDREEPYLPVGLEQLHLYRRPPEQLWCSLTVHPQEEGSASVLTADLALLGPEGELVAEVQGVRFQKVDRQTVLAGVRGAFADWLYEVEWEPQSRFGSSLDYIPTPIEIGSALDSEVASGVNRLEFYRELVPHLEAISLGYALCAFAEMGWEWRPGDRFSTTDLAQRLEVLDAHLYLLGCLLEMLAEEDILKIEGDQWKVLVVPELPDPQMQVEAAFCAFPVGHLELDLLTRCGSRLAAVMQGRCDPLQVLFPEGDLGMLARFYQESSGQRVMNELLQKGLLSSLAHIPQGRGVRVLEIGAGTGGTTAGLLPHFSPERTDYVFTDVSPLFTTRAQQRFEEYPFVRYQLLDIERDPMDQGFEEHAYDIIMAANALHTTRDLRETLQHVRSLLAPGGLLILLEGTFRQRWLDLIFGLTEGWWRFADRTLRPDHPLLSAANWQSVLQENGFSQMISLPSDEEREGLAFPQAVLVAQAAAIPSTETAESGKRWLVLADRRGVGQSLAERFRAVGDACVLAFPGEEYAVIDEQTFRVDPDESGDFQRLFGEMAIERDGLHGVVHCWSLDAVQEESITVDLEQVNREGCSSALNLIQALGQSSIEEPPSLWLVTEGAMGLVRTDAGPEARNPYPAQAPLWGMGKVIALEHPELKCVRLDLDFKSCEDEGQLLFEEIQAETEDDQIAFGGGGRYVPRLTRYQRGATEEPGPLFDAESSYLITGGLGALGLLIAEWMVEEQGVAHLALVGRREPDERVKERLQKLAEAGAEVRVVQTDVAVAEQIGRMVAEIEGSLPPVRGVIHAAGVLDDGVLASQTWERFSRVMAPKVQGAWNLHRQTQHWSLDFFAMFSSVAALLGSPGQSNHAAGNAFLDALASYRRSKGLAGLSINWGGWSEIGEAALREADEWMAKRGVRSIDPRQGLQVLEQLLSQPTAQVGVVPIDWSSFSKERSLPHFFSRFQESTIRAVGPKTDLREQLDAVPTDERRDYLVAHVQTQLARVLGLDSPQAIEVQQGFFDLGMDSLTSVELRNQLQESLGSSLPATLLFKYPTIEKLVDYLATGMLALESKPASDKEVSEPESSTREEVEQFSEEELAELIDEEFEALKPRDE